MNYVNVIGQHCYPDGSVACGELGGRALMRVAPDGAVTFDPEVVAERDGDTITLTAPWAGDASAAFSPHSRLAFTDGRPSRDLWPLLLPLAG